MVVEGQVLGGRSREVVVIDASGEEHRAPVGRDDGRFRVTVRDGTGTDPPVSVTIAPFEGTEDRSTLLWLHAAAINARVTGAVLRQSESAVWFVGAIQEGSPAAASALQVGDEIVSINGRRLENADPGVLGEAFELDPAQLRIEYSRCEETGTVLLPRIPRGVLWETEDACPCRSGACSADPRRDALPIAEAPRECGP